MLLAAELASMRGAMVESFPQTCAILRTTAGASDNQGGHAETEAEVGTYACRLSASRPVEHEVGDQIVSDLAWTALLPYNADVTQGDRLQVDEDEFEVAGTDADAPERIALQVTLRRLS